MRDKLPTLSESDIVLNLTAFWADQEANAYEARQPKRSQSGVYIRPIIVEVQKRGRVA